MSSELPITLTNIVWVEAFLSMHWCAEVFIDFLQHVVHQAGFYSTVMHSDASLKTCPSHTVDSSCLLCPYARRLTGSFLL